MPLGFFAQPPRERIDEFLRVCGWAAFPAVADFPLLIPAAFVNGLLDAADMFVVADRFEPSALEFLFVRRPRRGNQRRGFLEIAVGFRPQAKRPLLAVER
jgi:hypothetical protein